MIEKNHIPEHHANIMALIQYYEEGGKVPEGEEEVWAVEGQVSFRTRGYKTFEEMLEGFMFKLRYCDVSGLFCISLFFFFLLASLGCVSFCFIANSVFVFLSELEVLPTQPCSFAS